MKKDILTKYYQVLMYDYMEEYEETIKSLSEYISNIKNNPFAYNNRGLAYSETGMMEEAIIDFEESVKIRMNHIPYKNLGMMLERNDFRDKALEAYNNDIKIEPEFAYSYYERSVQYRLLGKNAFASKDLETYNKLNNQIKD
jgi:tetratricopeptide (TPR) repeat protein